MIGNGGVSSFKPLAQSLKEPGRTCELADLMKFYALFMSCVHFIRPTAVSTE